MDYIAAFSDGLQLLLNNSESNFISRAIRKAAVRLSMIQIELAILILIKPLTTLHSRTRAHTLTHTHTHTHTHTPLPHCPPAHLVCSQGRAPPVVEVVMLMSICRTELQLLQDT